MNLTREILPKTGFVTGSQSGGAFLGAVFHYMLLREKKPISENATQKMPVKKRPSPALQKKAATVAAELRALHPDATIELNFNSPFELLVATILSAQCTDARVNIITEKLFRSFKQPEDYLKKPLAELEELIKSGGFFRQKAKNIRGAAERIVHEFQGEVPRTIEELTTLPGVGRKTANVVLGNGYQIPGFPVDTHVRRLANRIGLTDSQDPEQIEAELTTLFPPEEWTLLSLTIIFHGRRVCSARKPACDRCPIAPLCDYAKTHNTKKNSTGKPSAAGTGKSRRVAKP